MIVNYAKFAFLTFFEFFSLHILLFFDILYSFKVIIICIVQKSLIQYIFQYCKIEDGYNINICPKFETFTEFHKTNFKVFIIITIDYFIFDCNGRYQKQPEGGCFFGPRGVQDFSYRLGVGGQIKLQKYL